MPELPEVETVRAGLAPYLVGSKVTSIEIFDQRSLKKNLGGPKGFIAELEGQRIQAVARRGKFLWMPFSDSRAIVGHLGMSGQILVRTPDFEPDGQTRVILNLETKRGEKYQMRFIDQRLFGGLALDDLVEDQLEGEAGFSPESRVGRMLPKTVSHIARDLLDPLFDKESVAERMLRKNSGIKRVLLDQNLLSGIGNIYADESLWLARLHYDQISATISKKKLLELIDIASDVLAKAVDQGGTSFDQQYKNVNGESGYFSQSLNAYGQTGEPCNRCGTPIRRDSWANRGSHFCPTCQINVLAEK